MRQIITCVQLEEKSPIEILRSYNNVVTIRPLNDLTAINENTLPGDLVVVYPGNYDLAAKQIILKNGVNWEFHEGVTITSTNPNGTFTDNNTAAVTSWKGSPVISNKNGFRKRIVLSNPNSKVKNFHWYWKGLVGIGHDTNLNPFLKITVFNENIGETLNWTIRDTTGIILLPSFDLKKTTSIIEQALDPFTEGNVKVVRYTAGENNELEILPYDEAGNIYLGSLNYEHSLDLRIYP